MTRLTCVFLVLLRLSIGWHFVFEGLEKLRGDSWSSEVYLREATGPLAPVFHSIAGDTVAERLTPKPIEKGVDLEKTDLAAYFPPVLEKEWQAWFDQFVNRYKLNDKQRAEAEARFQRRKAETVRWMLNQKVTVTKPASVGPALAVEKTVPEWIDTYQNLLRDSEELQKTELRRSRHTFYENEVVALVRMLKDDANRIRSILRTSLEKQTEAMRESLADVVTTEQYEQHGALPKKVSAWPWKWSLLGWSDFLVTWGLLILGGCLMLGFFSRTACVLGALLVLSFYLAMPPWPGLPDNPKAEGHYLIVNKNIVEILALLVLATTASGEWAGLDGLWRYLCPWNYRKKGSGVRSQESGVKSTGPVAAGTATKPNSQPSAS